VSVAPVGLAALRGPQNWALGAFSRFVILLGIVCLPVVLLGSSYYMSVVVTVVLYSIVVVSLDLLVGYGGLLSFAHGGIFALGAYIMGISAAKLGLPLLLGVFAAVIVNLALAFVIGVVTLRLKDFYLGVATLAFGSIVIQLLGAMVDITGGWAGLRGVPQASFYGITLTSDREFYALSVAGLIATLIISRNLVRSRFGRAIRAISNDGLGAEMLGVHAARHKVQLFMVSAFFTSLAGSLYGLYLRVVTPGNFDLPVMVELTLMLFLGGAGTLWGAVLGASVLRLLPEVLGNLQDLKTAIEGLIFILILMFMPSGLAGMIKLMGRRLSVPFGRVVAAPTDGRAVPSVVRESMPGSIAPSTRLIPDRPTTALLSVSHLSKRFGGLRAVSDVTFDVRPMQIKALIGPNGAGKTTVLNLTTNVFRPDEGRVTFRGEDLKSVPPHGLARLGLGRTFQTPRLFTSMTVLENVMVGQHVRLGTGLFGSAFPLPYNRREEQSVLEWSWAGLEFVGLAPRAHVLADELAFGERRLLEIARALAPQPRLLLLDEPAAGLNETEKDELGDLLTRLRLDGLTLLLVEHDMRLVMRISDEIIVLDHGEKIAEGRPDEVRSNEAVQRAYLGPDIRIHAEH
jgi:branched-chain amino acid transport system permease protein